MGRLASSRQYGNAALWSSPIKKRKIVRAVSLPQYGFLVSLYLQTAVNRLSKSVKY